MSDVIAQQAGRFLVVGAIGFCVDAGILTLLHSIFEFSLVQARLCSFAAAVTVTWYLNRQHTFADRKDVRAVREWGRYVAVNSVGALLNLGIFLLLAYRFALFASWPIIPLSIATAIALFFNFFGSRQLAFHHDRS